MAKLTEREIIKKLMDFVVGMGDEEMARFAGEIFGGECRPLGETPNGDFLYEFTPDSFYTGAFEHIVAPDPMPTTTGQSVKFVLYNITDKLADPDFRESIGVPEPAGIADIKNAVRFILDN